MESRLSKISPDLISSAAERIDWTYMPGDHMLGPTANHFHYREVGESAVRCIYASLLLANVDMPKSILDFGCGSGRVTRWVKVVFPDAELSVSDIRKDSLEFLETQFSVKTWASNPQIEKLVAPRQYDLIWSGSVLTHLPQERTIALLRKFKEWLNPGGVCVVTTHGKKMRKNLIDNRLKYMEEHLKSDFLAELHETGYSYAPYKGQDIGVSANSIHWIVDQIEALGCRIVSIGENAWDKHQDVVGFQLNA